MWYPALSVMRSVVNASKGHVDGRDELRELGQLILLEHRVLAEAIPQEQRLGI